MEGKSRLDLWRERIGRGKWGLLLPTRTKTLCVKRGQKGKIYHHGKPQDKKTRFECGGKGGHLGGEEDGKQRVEQQVGPFSNGYLGHGGALHVPRGRSWNAQNFGSKDLPIRSTNKVQRGGGGIRRRQNAQKSRESGSRMVFG